MENIEKNPELDNMDEATLCQIMRTILEKGIEITQERKLWYNGKKQNQHGICHREFQVLIFSA